MPALLPPQNGRCSRGTEDSTLALHRNMAPSYDETAQPAGSSPADSFPQNSEPANFLRDLDRRQNDVIRELDALNDQIEKVLVDWNREEHGEAESEKRAA